MRRATPFLPTLLLLTAAVNAGCGDETAQVGTLELSLGDDRIAGIYAHDGETLAFSGETLAADVHVVKLQLHGLVLEATVDQTDGTVVARDGYAAADGTDTQLLEEDRLLVYRFVKALEQEVPDIAARPGLPGAFDEVVNKWAEWSPAMALSQVEMYDEAHLTSMCYWAQCANGSYTGCCASRWYDNGNHDCSTCNNGDGRCQTIVQLGDHCSCDGDAWVWENSAWVCKDQGHASRRYAVGNCYGRYGGGCGSSRSYNWESLKHDECVRNGHVITSSWCSDELYHTGNSGNCY